MADAVDEIPEAEFNPFSVIDPKEVQKLLQDDKVLIGTLLNHPDAKIKSIAEAMQLKKNVAISFTEFLLYIIKLFLSAVEDGTITMKNSVRQSTKQELSHNSLTLRHVRKDFCSAKDNSSLDDSVAIVIGCATKVRDVIKSLQKNRWLRLFRSAKNISTLIPIFEKITIVVSGVQCIECKDFSELFGNVADLQASLVDIEQRLHYLKGAGVTASVIIGIGGIICMIVGGILLATPAGVPLLAVGGAGVGVSIAIGRGTALYSYIATKYLDYAKLKGDFKGDKFVKNDKTFTELLQDSYIAS